MVVPVAIRLIKDKLNHLEPNSTHNVHSEVLCVAIETIISQKIGGKLRSGELAVLEDAMNVFVNFALHADNLNVRLRVEKLLKSVIENPQTHEGMRKAADEAMLQFTGIVAIRAT